MVKLYGNLINLVQNFITESLIINYKLKKILYANVWNRRN